MKLANSGIFNPVSATISFVDYATMDPEEARKDFQERLRQYESIYETLDEVKDRDIPYIKLYNVWKT